MPRKLTVKEESFCLIYSRCGNATQAYKQAGYKASSDNIAAVQGHILLKKDKIAKRLQQLADAKASAEICGADEMQRELTNIIRDPDVKPQDKARAIELLAKMQGALLPRAAENDVQITVNLGDFG